MEQPKRRTLKGHRRFNRKRFVLIRTCTTKADAHSHAKDSRENRMNARVVRVRQGDFLPWGVFIRTRKPRKKRKED